MCYACMHAMEARITSKAHIAEAKEPKLRSSKDQEGTNHWAISPTPQTLQSLVFLSLSFKKPTLKQEKFSQN